MILVYYIHSIKINFKSYACTFLFFFLTEKRIFKNIPWQKNLFWLFCKIYLFFNWYFSLILLQNNNNKTSSSIIKFSWNHIQKNLHAHQNFIIKNTLLIELCAIQMLKFLNQKTSCWKLLIYIFCRFLQKYVEMSLLVP